MKHEELGQSSLIRISLNVCIGPLYTGFANNDTCSGGFETHSSNLTSARPGTVWLHRKSSFWWFPLKILSTRWTCLSECTLVTILHTRQYTLCLEDLITICASSHPCEGNWKTIHVFSWIFTESLFWSIQEFLHSKQTLYYWPTPHSFFFFLLLTLRQVLPKLPRLAFNSKFWSLSLQNRADTTSLYHRVGGGNCICEENT